MNIQTEYLAGYYIVVLDEPEEEVGDLWGINWFTEIDEWCTETFGISDMWGEIPAHGWKRMRNKYFFVEEKHREWFILRWS